jgi:polyhydroxyalkanoate synthase
VPFRIGRPAGQTGPLVDAGALVRRIDPLGFAGALAQVGTRTATRALPSRVAGLGVELAKIAVGKSSVAPDPKDWRFANRAWRENPAFHRLCQSYLAWAGATTALVDDAGLDWRTEQRAKLATTLLTTTLAPTNVGWLNPDSVERAYETGGRSVVRGFENLWRDVATNRGFPRSVDPGAFVVGRDLAATPGAVVHRSEVCELIQYAPTTETVGTVPLVLVPPQINKYYFMDLAPGRSFVEFCVRQGFQIFVLSWRNPTTEHRGWGIGAYVDAVEEASRAACEITGTDRVNTVSLCAGGITTAAVLGHLAARRDSLVNCATFAVTLLDFSVPTMIGMFATPGIAGNARRSSSRGGVLGSRNTTALFSMLRPNDLIWNYWVRNNLMGEDPPAFDILAWNADSTRLPAALHADFLDMFLRNSLAGGEFSVGGESIDLGRVDCDAFVVGAKTDHLTAWKACYASTQLLGGENTFALSSSGHIQSLVNPPGNPKMSVAVGPAADADPDRWLAGAEPAPGSWWEPWSAWARKRSGAPRPAPRVLGSRAHPAQEPAPGCYVHQR